MKTLNLIIVCFLVALTPITACAQGMKKLKKNLKGAVEATKARDTNTQQSSSGLFSTDTNSNSANTGNSTTADTNQKPGRETITIDFGHEYLENFEMDAYQGKLVGNEGGYGSIMVKDKNHKYKAMMSIRQMSIDNGLYMTHLNKLLSEEGKSEFYIAYNANEFERRRVLEKYKSSGLHERIVEVSQTIPSMKEAAAYRATSFSTYDFDKKEYKLLVQVIDVAAMGRPKVYFHYKIEPDEAEVFMNTYPTKRLFAARTRYSNGRGGLYSDDTFQNKIADYSPEDLTIEIKGKESPYIVQGFNDEKLDLYVDVAKTACIEKYRDKIDCECFENEYRLFMMDILQSVYQPNVLLYMLQEQMDSDRNVYVISGPNLRLHALTEDKSDAIDRYLNMKGVGVAGPFDIADLRKNLQEGKLTEELYAYEAYANFYLEALGSEYNTREKEESFCVLRTE